MGRHPGPCTQPQHHTASAQATRDHREGSRGNRKLVVCQRRHGEQTRDCTGPSWHVSFTQKPSWPPAAAEERFQTEILESPRAFRFPPSHRDLVQVSKRMGPLRAPPRPFQTSSGHPPLPPGAHPANARAFLPAWGVGAGAGRWRPHKWVPRALRPPLPLDNQGLPVPGR